MEWKKYVLLSIAIFPIVVCAQNLVGAKHKVIEGVGLYDDGEYAAALKKYEEALDLDANNIDALTEKALTLETNGNSKDAIEICKTIIKLYPKDIDPTVYVTYGNALDHLGQPNKALKIYKEGIAKFPDYYQLYFNQGITLFNDKQYERAVLSIQEATRLNPSHSGSYNVLGTLYSNNRIAAILATCRYLSLDNDSKRAMNNYEFLMEKLYQGVTKESSNSISIQINEQTLKLSENKKTQDNDFAMTEMILSMTAALAITEDSKYPTNPDKVAAMLESVCSGLRVGKADGKGYFYEFLVPYFIEMKDKNLLIPFSNIILIINDDKDAIKYYKEHSEAIQAFYDWSKAYEWRRN